jgi:hypothetical protein
VVVVVVATAVEVVVLAATTAVRGATGVIATFAGRAWILPPPQHSPFTLSSHGRGGGG